MNADRQEPGQELDRQQAAVEPAHTAGESEQEVRERGRDAALGLLAARARSHAELRDRLRAKGYDTDVVAWVCRDMERLGLLDDRSFAEMWIRDRLRLRPKGRRALIAELRAKGVAADVAEAAISCVMAEEAVSEPELCREAAEKWLRTQGARVTDRNVRQRRLAAFLARRGFSGGAVRDALSRIASPDGVR